MLEPVIRREADLEWEHWDDAELRANSDVRWKLLISGERTPSAELTMGIAEIPPGAKLIRHSHAQAETYYITQGAGRIRINGVESGIGPGSAVYIPPGAHHSVSCEGDAPLAFVFIFPCNRFDEVNYHFDE